MKNIWITAAFLLTVTFASAQQGDQQPNDDQLQQQAPRETQRTVERSAKVEAVKTEGNAQVDAEKETKDKSQTQRQTKVQPVGINPSDSDAKKPKKAN